FQMKFLAVAFLLVCVLEFHHYFVDGHNHCGSDCCEGRSSTCCSSCGGSSSCGGCSHNQCNSCCMNTCASTCATPICRQSCTDQCERKCDCRNSPSPPGPGSTQGVGQNISISLDNSIQTTNNVNVPINISLTNQNNIATDLQSSSADCCNEGEECDGKVTCPPPVTIKIPTLVPYVIREPIYVPRPYPIERQVYLDRPIPIPIPIPQPMQQQVGGCAQGGCQVLGQSSCSTCWPYGYGGQYGYGKK
ncbi:hypothetical protein AMK59_3156, partial [Oryctes borbonicus]